MSVEAPRRGRPSTGKAKSVAERSEAKRVRQAEAGLRAIHPVITAEAAAVLDAAVAGGMTISDAVSAALVAFKPPKLHR